MTMSMRQVVVHRRTERCWQQDSVRQSRLGLPLMQIWLLAAQLLGRVRYAVVV